MNRSLIENAYKVNGLTNYQLRTTEDLRKVHDIDYKTIEGYENLDELSRELFAKFIINFMNGWGIKSRVNIIPKGIYHVKEHSYLGKLDSEDEDDIVTGGSVTYKDRKGETQILHEWSSKEYLDIEPIKDKVEYYLRFEYELWSEKEWLHVISEKEWY